MYMSEYFAVYNVRTFMYLQRIHIYDSYLYEWIFGSSIYVSINITYVLYGLYCSAELSAESPPPPPHVKLTTHLTWFTP